MPRESGFIPPDIAKEYAKRFVCDFREFLKIKHCRKIKVSFAKRKKLKLEDIIPGNKTRKYFELFLNAYPLSHHPADIQRLDIFICALHRYSRKKIDLDLLHVYLFNVLKWPEEECTSCCKRINTGCEILKMNKKF